MAQTTGFRFRGKGEKTAVCNDCIGTLSLNTAGGEELNTGQFADEFCLVCGDNITGPGTLQNTSQEIDYPLGLCILISNQFNGAHPIIDTNGTVQEISPGVKRSVSQRTKHDPVIVKVWPDQTQLLSTLQQFADDAAQLGPIRGYTETYTDSESDSEDEVTGYDVFFFAKQ